LDAHFYVKDTKSYGQKLQNVTQLAVSQQT